MKVTIVALVLLSTCVLAAQAGSGRRLLQAPAPEGCPTVFDVAEAAGLSTLVEAMSLDELESSLDNSTGYPLTYTVFAPTNEAFDEAFQALGASDLMAVKDAGQLDSILQYHFLIYPYTVSTLESLGTVGTNYKNQTLTFGAGGTIQSFGSNATITQGDIPACQSIIHVIDTVLVPNFEAVAPPSLAPGVAST